MSKYFQASWKLKEILIVLIIAVLSLMLVDLAFLFSGTEDYLKSIIQNDSNSIWLKELIIIGLFFLQSIIILVPLIVLVLKNYKKWSWEDFGFDKFKLLNHLGLSILGYFLYLGISFAIIVIVIFGGLKIPGYQISEPVLPLFGTTNVAIIIAAIVIIFIAPILEEVFFRGFILQGLVNKFGKSAGAIVTALLFATLHLQFESFIPIFILSLILSIIFIRSKSIWPCILFHIINNIVAFTVELMIIKGVIPLDF